MLAIKSANEPYHASKWLSSALLIDGDEMRSLFDHLGNFYMFAVGRVVKENEACINHETFLNVYTRYIEILKTGQIPDEATYRPFFASVLTTSLDHLYALPVGKESQLIRIAKPVVQMQVHCLDYSKADQKFHPMVFGKDSVLWGVQFSYPQLFEDPQTYAVHKVADTPQFPNTKLFRSLQKWVREETVPTPFIVEEKVINVPMRLGKKCFSWINQHPQFAKKGLRVES